MHSFLSQRSRIYSTWENRSLAVNSASTSEADILKRLLVALAKVRLSMDASEKRVLSKTETSPPSWVYPFDREESLQNVSPNSGGCGGELLEN